MEFEGKSRKKEAIGTGIASRAVDLEPFCIDTQGRVWTEDKSRLDLSAVEAYANASKEAFIHEKAL